MPSEAPYNEPTRADQRLHRGSGYTGVLVCSRAVLVLLVLAACSANPRTQAHGVEDEATVRVENHAWMDMTVYAVASGQRVRLGSVSGNTTAVLRIPPGVVGLGRSLTFVADPLGSSRTSSSFEIYVRPGDEITLTIPAQAG